MNNKKTFPLPLMEVKQVRVYTLTVTTFHKHTTKRVLNMWLTLSRCLKLLSKVCWAFLASERCWGEKWMEVTHSAMLAEPLPLSLPTPSPLCAPVSDPAGIWWVPRRCPSSCFRPRALAGRRNRWVRSGSPETTSGCWICRQRRN